MSRFAHCVFCDDVRQEVGGKMSLMGIYGADLIITGTLPIVLPKLVIAGWVICDLANLPTQLRWVVKWRDGADLYRMEATDLNVGSRRDGATQGSYSAVMQFFPFSIEKEGVLEAFAETEQENLLAGRLYIQARSPAAQPAA